MAPRGNPILGLSRFRENSTLLPYTTLIYGNGPGNHQPRRDPTLGPNSTDSPYYVQYAAIHQEEAFHDGSDVAIFAAGPWSHLFQGVQEQSYIAHVFAYAMCVGDYSNQPHCRMQQQLPNDPFIGGTNSIGADESSRRLMVINNPSLGRPNEDMGNRYGGIDLTRTTSILGSQFIKSSASETMMLARSPCQTILTSAIMLIVSMLLIKQKLMSPTARISK